ncbi:hypothetical protein ACI0FR_02549 [Paenochrobactrum sp. BZR 201-1]
MEIQFYFVLIIHLPVLEKGRLIMAFTDPASRVNKTHYSGTSSQTLQPAWSIKLRTGKGQAGRKTSRGWSRYERLSLVTVLLLSGVMFAVTAGLHWWNYDLETRSSSTSGSHSSFYKDTDSNESSDEEADQGAE